MFRSYKKTEIKLLKKITTSEMKNILKNRSIFIREMESIINLPKQEAPGQDGLIVKFYQTIKEKIIPVLYNAF